ncbi:DNA polymerase sliding clamp B2 [Aeropyrum pernix K1]|uniref:DNA polymerase sliding clamp 3 n=1 Tax=Aeropyrum pernix (strain ATCC 700893 / DSM 11879 / JCM 9820 / NBRC 100138 / K1) TaxID=272557 RepID=PCNA3_AERPE|nr:DNA polymerase sliding clamp [Aeropyrum pernix]Q9YEZ5.2 RecName: Full=DNA polymerase sliding clamp 3; AltName: Full=DNA polymerase sliding clamp B2; AltName: Full=Proliferating cell nuclear antigen homolog 3; Short=PCNA 3 [Aeropyrum pernix K1]BAA79401.2 DNA polymerase sliding clamp B2 [Aeropyrum pernix K1]
MADARFYFSDARTWRYMVASIEKIIEEGVFVATGEGLSLRALDTSHVAMVDLYYPNTAFIEYDIGGESVEFGVSFDLLSKVLRRARKEDELVLEVEGSRLAVKLKSRGERTFRIPQVVMTYEKLPEPKVSFTVRARMLGSTFREAVRDLEPHSETLTLRALEDALLLVGSSEMATVEIELSQSRGSLLDYEAESQDRASYSIEYFSEMLSAAQAADAVVVSFSEDAPVRVDMEYLGGGRLTFYVSPKIE